MGFYFHALCDPVFIVMGLCLAALRAAGAPLSYSIQFYSIDYFTVVCSVTWPLNGRETGGDLVLTRPHCFCCANQVVLMLTSCIYMRKAERSVSKQGHLQPRCHSKTRSLSRQL